VLSSEWDYSPFTYPEIAELPGFVLIGLPASESGNPLLIPLAGHELGHAVWLKRKIETALRVKILQVVAATIESRWETYSEIFRPSRSITPADLTTDLVVLPTWERAIDWALRQAEETLCDFVGLRLFGAAYFHAFAYLLAPDTGAARPVYYPARTRRIDNLITAAGHYNIEVPAQYADMFIDSIRVPLDVAGAFLSDIADESLQQIVSTLIAEANDAITSAGIPEASETDILRILDRFRKVVPIEGAVNLAAIVNAAWRAYLDTDFWKDLPQVSMNKDRVLKELTLKNVEVFEIEQIHKEPR
jgi:hypothetical protein